MSGGKFLKEWQVTVTIKLLSENFPFHNLLQITQTQEIITHRVSKIHKWIWVMQGWDESCRGEMG